MINVLDAVCSGFRQTIAVYWAKIQMTNTYFKNMLIKINVGMYLKLIK